MEVFEKMVQVFDKEKDLKRPIKVEFYVTETVTPKIPVSKAKRKVVKVKPKKKHRALVKFFRKVKYNPKYLEETYTLGQLKAKIHSKGHGMRQEFYI
jgi:hypothetical protein